MRRLQENGAICSREEQPDRDSVAGGVAKGSEIEYSILSDNMFLFKSVYLFLYEKKDIHAQKQYIYPGAS